MGKEGLREIGVFLRESLMSTSLMVLNGRRLRGSWCQHSSTRSWKEGEREREVSTAWLLPHPLTHILYPLADNYLPIASQQIS